MDPAGEPIGRVQFDVQDFVPQTLKVTLTPSTKALDIHSPIALAVDGEFLYGAPAAGLKGEAELRVVRDPSPVVNAKGYSFGLIDEKFDEKVQRLDLPAANDAGHVEITDTIEPLNAETVPLKAVISAGMFEPSGRIVKDQVELPIHTQPLLIGLKPRFTDNRTQEGLAVRWRAGYPCALDDPGSAGGCADTHGRPCSGRDAFEMAVANLGIQNYPRWWHYSSYYSEMQDAAGLLAIAAEVGNEDVIRRALERLVSLAPSSEKLDTQEKAWILAAAHALNKNESAHSLTVNGKASPNLKVPTAFAPTVDDVRSGYIVVNTGEHDL